MYLEKSFKLKLWSEWDSELTAAAEEFIDENKISPNRFIANPWTLSQIEYVTEISELRQHTYGYNPVSRQYDIPCSEGESIHINSYIYPDESFELVFYFGEEMKDRDFKIVFCDEDDDDNDDESETPVPVDEPVLTETY